MIFMESVLGCSDYCSIFFTEEYILQIKSHAGHSTRAIIVDILQRNEVCIHRNLETML